jgi:hypothetical protein
MTKLLSSIVILGLACPVVTQAQSMSGDTLTAIVLAVAPAYSVSPSCIMEIIDQEDPDHDPTEWNQGGSSAYGLGQFTSDGVWTSTPLGQAGVDRTVTSAAQQVEMIAWALANGYSSAWGYPPGC